MKKYDYITLHVAAHPTMQAQDLIKFCYQAARGGEHLLADVQAAKQRFDLEFEEIAPRQGQLCEVLSPTVARVHMDVWKEQGLPKAWLFSLFEMSQPVTDSLSQWLDAAKQACPHFADAIAAYQRSDQQPIRHSQAFRQTEQPSYRVVSRELCRLIPILQQAPASGVIAIDGRAGAGKTTMAQRLGKILSASVIAMDDFFLPPALRTPQRLAQIGGNIDYDRFADEVLPGLADGSAFVYTRFDCSCMALTDRVEVPAGLRIVEGVYSLHPRFGNYADLTVFCDVSAQEQRRRIDGRNSKTMAQRFYQEWIPMEESYFTANQTAQKTDIYLKNEQDLDG